MADLNIRQGKRFDVKHYTNHSIQFSNTNHLKNYLQEPSTCENELKKRTNK